MWLLSTPACAQVNYAMQELTEVSYTTNDHYKDVSKALQERDMTDTLDVLGYLSPRSSFGENSTLHSIASGITAKATVNCECAQQVGKKVLEGIVGKPQHNTHSRKNARYAPSATEIPLMLETKPY